MEVQRGLELIYIMKLTPDEKNHSQEQLIVHYSYAGGGKAVYAANFTITNLVFN